MLVAVLLQVALVASPQGGGAPPDPAASADALNVHAVRASEPVRIDGVLDDSVWSRATPVSGFLQREPKEGAPATERTDVRVVFDNGAVYIGAEMFDAAPDSITGQLARRDNFVTADRFWVFLDTYRDKRTGFYFALNASGVQYDGTLLNDDWDDNTWDGVWQGAVHRTPTGWTAEMRIPYSQLRFKPGADQVWGVNFRRDIARRNERDYLVYSPSNASGFVSRFPELQGLAQLNPPRRLELLPYATARAEFVSHDPGDPYNDGSVYGIGVGGDFRVGLGSNLTINGTINPDFGQVELDPAVVNLSDVEIFFPERRPFFVEGANTFNFGYGGSNNYWGFNWASHDFLYTRRIGRAPTGATPDDASYVDEPGGTQIIGALKLSGKVGGWNIGALSSLTRREFADYQVNGVPGNVEVEPTTSWNAIRVQKELNGGRQGIGIISTITQRFFNDDNLPAQMNRGAYTVGLDGWTFLDHDRAWVLTGWGGGSLVTGTAERMTSLQQNSTHYYQRPDQDYLHVDSLATSLSGFAGRLLVNKQKGPVQFNASLGALNPGFELNDIGFAQRTDLINSHVLTGYRWTRPTRTYQSLNFNIAAFGTWDFGGNNTGAGLFSNVNVQWRNFWWTWARVNVNPQTVNIRNTRGGPAMLNTPGFNFGGGFESDSRHLVTFGLEGYVNRYQQGADDSWGVDTWVEWRPMQRLQVRMGPGLSRNLDGAQYVGTWADPTATATYGNRYVFGDLDQWTLSGNFRVNWIFTPKLSLELYLQPYISSGDYRALKELAAPRTFDFNVYGENGSTYDPATGVAYPDGPGGAAAPIEIGNPDFSFASLRGNAVLRWEWHPGSTVFLVWTHNRDNSGTNAEFDPGQSFDNLLQAPADNVLLVKFTWWLNP
ncbi:MAG: putative rane associated hydrolase [Gemmatimonadetes bacterium]|nr:putative rane associated hydrolase [Gemmatimonadota bacterium]